MKTKHDTSDENKTDDGAVSAPVAPAAEAAPSDTAVSLDEYCMQLSKSDRRVELIGAFHKSEMRQRRGKDTEANYSARYQTFINKPV